MFCAKCGKEIVAGADSCYNCGEEITKDRVNMRSVNTAQSVSKNFMPISKEEYEKRKNRNIKIGLWWLIAPFVTLVCVLILYAFASFAMNRLVNGVAVPVEDSYLTITRIFRVLLGLMGILSVGGIVIGIPLGVIYLTKRVKLIGLEFDPRSGKGHASEIPPEINHWSWGAVGLTWIWGVAHRVWISFLVFIPLVNIIVLIYLGVAGNKLAWRADTWESVEVFLENEKKWKPWGVVFFLLGIVTVLVRWGSLGR